MSISGEGKLRRDILSTKPESKDGSGRGKPKKNPEGYKWRSHLHISREKRNTLDARAAWTAMAIKKSRDSPQQEPRCINHHNLRSRKQSDCRNGWARLRRGVDKQRGRRLGSRAIVQPVWKKVATKLLIHGARDVKRREWDGSHGRSA